MNPVVGLQFVYTAGGTGAAAGNIDWTRTKPLNVAAPRSLERLARNSTVLLARTGSFKREGSQDDFKFSVVEVSTTLLDVITVIGDIECDFRCVSTIDLMGLFVGL